MINKYIFILPGFCLDNPDYIIRVVFHRFAQNHRQKLWHCFHKMSKTNHYDFFFFTRAGQYVNVIPLIGDDTHLLFFIIILKRSPNLELVSRDG